MLFTFAPLLLAAGLFIGMLLCLEVGRRLGLRTLRRDPQASLSGIGALEGVVFSVFGLLVAFTFSGAPGRLETRKQLIAEEVNAIGTAYLRVDLLAPDAQPAMREEFRAYVDSRLEVIRAFPDPAKVRAAFARSAKIQQRIWTAALDATRTPGAGHPEAGKLLIPALNEMFDITTTRLMAAMIHVPEAIFLVLFLFAFLCSVLAGYATAGSAKLDRLHTAAFAIVVSLVIYLVLEIEYPRAGFIRMDSFDQMMVDLRHDID